MILQTISQFLPTVVFNDSKVVLLTLCTHQIRNRNVNPIHNPKRNQC